MAALLGDMKIIALCITRIYDDRCVDMIGALNEEIVAHGGRLLIFSTVSDLFFGTHAEQGEAKIFDLMNYSMIDAVIVYDESIKNKDVLASIISRTKDAGKPVYFIGQSRDDCVNFNFDYKNGFKFVIRHVIKEHNIRSLHMIAGVKGNEFSEERIECFKETLLENNIPFYENMISYGNFWERPTEKAVKKLIDENRVPRALICANDTMALSAALTLKKAGIKIPEDVIVTGFDGIVEASFNDPKITTCLCSYEDIAKQIVSVIFDVFDGKETQKEYLTEPKLILSESCGCRKDESGSVCEYISSITKRFNRFQEEDKCLNRISLKIQNCTDISEIGRIIDDQSLMYDMAVVVKDEFMNPALNPMRVYSNTTFGETVHVIYKSESNSESRTRITEFPVKELYHDFENFIRQLKAPFVFNSMSYINMTFGYICYFYRDFFKDNYVKTMQITMTLSNALSGFRAARYQRYLLEHIEESYRHDAMTGLYNRSGFMQIFPEFKRSCGGIITAVLADLDDLKHINDTYGHDEGDVAIRAVAQALDNSCPKGSICIRFGGDEMFAVVKGRVDDEIRTKINNWLAEFNRKSGKPYKVSASVGIYTTDSDDADFEMLVRKSDQLMYNEKIAKKIKR